MSPTRATAQFPRPTSSLAATPIPQSFKGFVCQQSPQNPVRCQQLKKVSLVSLSSKKLMDDTMLSESSGEGVVRTIEKDRSPAVKPRIKVKLKDSLVAQYQLHPKLA